MRGIYGGTSNDDTKKPEARSIPMEEQIRQHAHELYMQRGGQDGSDLDYWLQAEEGLLQGQEKAV
jgi:hypothetical protein